MILIIRIIIFSSLLVPYISYSYDFDPEHSCFSNSSSPVCERLALIAEPNWNITSLDYIVTPHRGLWGNKSNGDSPENSIDAIEQADNANYREVEIDVMRAEEDGLVLSHDYPLFRLTNETDESIIIADKTVSELSELNLRRRNGEISDSQMLDFRTALTYIRDNNMIVMLDAKERIGKYVNGECVAQCDSETIKHKNWMRIVKLALSISQNTDLNAMKNVVIKTYRTPDELINGACNGDDCYQGLGEIVFKRVMWYPMIISNNHGNNIENITDYIDSWQPYVNSVIGLETNFMQRDDTMLVGFSKDGASYENVMHYIQATLSKRSGVFTDEPVGKKGVVTRWSVWKFKDPALDIRANISELIKIPYLNNMIVTSDNAIAWSELNEEHY